MDFMGIGPLELLLVIFIMFLVFGPAKLPEVARGLGRGLRGLRKDWSDFSRDLDKEVKETKDTVTKAVGGEDSHKSG